MTSARAFLRMRAAQGGRLTAIVKEMFGRQRLKAIICRHSEAEAATILEAAFADQARFTRGARADDDLTLVIINDHRLNEFCKHTKT